MRVTKNLIETVVSAVMSDTPKEDYDTKIRAAVKALAVKSMPPAVAKAYKTHPTWIETRSSWYPAIGSVNHPSGGDDLDYKSDPVVMDLLAKAKLQADTRHKLRSQLLATLKGFTTVKALREGLPDLVKYFPVETATGYPLTVNTGDLLTALKGAGWQPKKEKANERSKVPTKAAG